MECCVAGCDSMFSQRNKNLRFYHFPREPVLIAKWLNFCGIQFKSRQQIESFRVCNQHFEKCDYTEFKGNVRLRSNAIPTCINVFESENRRISQGKQAVPIPEPIEFHCVPIKAEPAEEANLNENIPAIPDAPDCATPELPQVHSAPMSTTELNQDQLKLVDFLAECRMPELYPVFNDEQIYQEQLLDINEVNLQALLQPHVKMRKMIDFQYKLNIWKSKKIDQQQFNLDSIFNASSRRNIFLHTMRLSPGHRFALIEDIVDYFVRRKIPFTLPIREDLTRQICRRFKSEIPWYYSDDGLASGGQDQLYQHYLQVSLKAGTGNSGLKVASVESLAPNDETAGSSEAAKSTPMPPQKSPTVVNAPIKPHLVRVVLPARQAVPIGQFRSSNAAVAPAAAASAAAATTATPLQLRPQSLAAPPPNILRTSPMMALPPVKLPPISVRLSSRLMAPPAAKPSPKPNETGNNMIRAVVGQQALKLSQQLAKRLLPVRRASVAEERPRILTKVTTVSGESYVIRNMDAVKRPANGFRVLNANAPPPKVQRVEAPVMRPQTPPAPEIPEPQSDPLGSDDDDDDEHSDSDGTRSASPVGDEPSAAAEEDEGEQMGVGENGDDIAEIRPEAQETVTFLKAELFQTDLAESLGSLTEVNKNILSLEFEQQLGLENRFRDDEFCKTYTKQFSGVLLRSSRFSIDEKHFSQQSLSKQMTLALFLLPAALNPSMSFVFRGKMISNFISVCSSVQDFVSSLPRPSRGPYVAIIGKLLAPVSYVLYYQKKVYRFVELWHALDMAIKIHITYKVHMIADSANAWQFVMLHFYQMEKDVEFVYPSVKTLQAFLCLH